MPKKSLIFLGEGVFYLNLFFIDNIIIYYEIY